MRILAYTIMPNHWHLALYPVNDKDLSVFMQRLTNAHTRKVHAVTKTNGTGHLYQGRFKSFLVDSDRYLLTLLKYIERNPVRAQLVEDPSLWRWGSVWRREKGGQKHRQLLSPAPIEIPTDYSSWLREIDKQEDLEFIRKSVQRGVPYGRYAWVDNMVTKHQLESTVRQLGRPRKYQNT